MARTVDNLLTLAEVDEGRLGLLPQRRHARRDRAAVRPRSRWRTPSTCSRRRGAACQAGPDPQRRTGDLELHQNAIKYAHPDGPCASCRGARPRRSA
jgi:hypothetical protein